MKVHWPNFKYSFENHNAKYKILIYFLGVVFRSLNNVTIVQYMTFWHKSKIDSSNAQNTNALAQARIHIYKGRWRVWNYASSPILILALPQNTLTSETIQLLLNSCELHKLSLDLLNWTWNIVYTASKQKCRGEQF